MILDPTFPDIYCLLPFFLFVSRLYDLRMTKLYLIAPNYNDNKEELNSIKRNVL